MKCSFLVQTCPSSYCSTTSTSMSSNISTSFDSMKPRVDWRIDPSTRSLQFNNFSSRLAALSVWSSIVKCSRKNGLSPQAIMLMTCFPYKFVAPSSVKQMSECLLKASRTLFMVIAYFARISSPLIAAEDGS